MKQVWKCDHCHDTETEKSKMVVHENECYFNPAVKDCGSCANNKPIPWETTYACSFGMDFEDDKMLPCVKWELADA